MLLLVQIVALGLGLGLASIWPRAARPILNRDSAVNLATGGVLYGLKVGVGLTGVFELRVGLLSTSWLPAWLQLGFAFLVLDLARYWLHRLDHRIPILWHFHRVHHSLRTMDSTAGFRMHLADFMQLAVLPVLLFGVILDTSAWSPLTVPLAMVPGIVADALEHSNLRWTWNRYVFNNPLFHSWHHVRDAQMCDGNYANALPLWDVLFGSDVSQAEPPAAFGLTDDQDLAPTVIGLQLLRSPTGPRPTG